MSNRLSTRRRLLLAKIETTYGTDPVPTAATNAILVRNLDVKPLEATVVGRDLVRPYMGASPALLADQHVMATFEVELAGSGTAGTVPGYDVLLRACGLSSTVVASTSVTYAPVSTAFESVTLYYYDDGNLHKIIGCAGDLEILLKAKSIPVLKFSFTGLYAAATAVSLPTTPAYTAFISPLIVNQQNTPTFSMFGVTSGILDEYSVKLGNKVEYRNLPGAQYAAILDRQVSGNIVMQAVTQDVHDFYADAVATATGAVFVIHGTVAGNICKVNLPFADLQNPTLTDNSGVQMLNVPIIGTPSAGNDEFSLLLT